MNIYTRTGDDGTTDSLCGRTDKDSDLIWVYGSIDELSAFLGMALAFLDDEKCNDIKIELGGIMKELFDFSAEFSESSGYVKQFDCIEPVLRLEKLIDKHSGEAGEFAGFILPCGHKAAAILHVARTVVRRAERYMVAMNKNQAVNKHCMCYINRLSDYLFIVARVVNGRYGVKEEIV